jgi:hypothetical protein
MIKNCGVNCTGKKRPTGYGWQSTVPCSWNSAQAVPGGLMSLEDRNGTPLSPRCLRIVLEQRVGTVPPSCQCCCVSAEQGTAGAGTAAGAGLAPDLTSCLTARRAMLLIMLIQIRVISRHSSPALQASFVNLLTVNTWAGGQRVHTAMMSPFGIKNGAYISRGVARGTSHS